MSSIEAQQIGKNVRYWRTRRALSQGQLASAAGVALTTISRTERGHHRPQPSTIHKLAIGLGVGVEEILHGLF